MIATRRLTVCGIPEIGGFRAEDVTHVVSIADPRAVAMSSVSMYGPDA